MQPKILGLVAVTIAAATVLTFSTANPINAATADSILANAKNERAAQARKYRASGCSRERKCVAWAKGAPGTFVGKCTKFAMQWSCPIKVN
jgi:hypothetical protein